MRRVLEAQAQQVRDPFLGAVERHILDRSQSIFDMEERAARAAIERAGIGADKIDLLLTNTTVPEVLLGNPACELHQRLGLPRACLATHLDVATHSFMMQLTLAEAMISAGRARYALLVQSCAPSRLLHEMDPIAPFFGDAATAVVVGPVSTGRGVLASVNFTDGRFPRTLVATVPGAAFYDDGHIQLHIADPRQMQSVFLLTADVCKESIDAALDAAGRKPRDVSFFCIHQGTPWLRRVVQEYADLAHTKSIETFQETGYLFASTIPAALATAQERRLLVAGDTAVIAGGGPGMTYGAAVLAWGT